MALIDQTMPGRAHKHMHEDNVTFADWVSSLINHATAQHPFCCCSRFWLCVYVCVCVPEQMRGQHRLPSRSQPTATSSSNWKAVSRAARGLDSGLPCSWATIRALWRKGWGMCQPRLKDFSAKVSLQPPVLTASDWRDVPGPCSDC